MTKRCRRQETNRLVASEAKLSCWQASGVFAKRAECHFNLAPTSQSQRPRFMESLHRLTWPLSRRFVVNWSKLVVCLI